ncbi:MAG: sulfatase [Bacteroidales bacterium]|nr:sulfatase [Bacteroidales bacterium]
MNTLILPSKLLLGLALLSTFIFAGSCNNTSPELKPNIIIIFTDDQGYADVGVYGAEGFVTPNIDAMASGGMRFTDFYVGSPVCSPSRAALLTGCYPQRVGIPAVLFPEHVNDEWYPEDRKTKTGIHQDELTLAEMLKANGYATGCFGKWHLGHHKQFLPLQQGFDEYFGLPYSNDMRPGNNPGPNPYPPLPLMDGNQVHRFMQDDQSMLTREYTEKAIDFIKRHKEGPFFVYLPHTMPHIPLYISGQFAGKSEYGIYGDVIEEIDWSVGQINQTLEELGISENTWVTFATDNGPWLIFGAHGGLAKPLREGKFTTFEGGMRVPCIMKWPGTIPAGKECSEMAATIDLLPTIAKITGSELPVNKIDGNDISNLILGEKDAVSPTDAYYYYNGWELQAVRSGKWKLHLPHKYSAVVEAEDGNRYGRKGIPSEIGLSLFNLEEDISESINVAGKYPEVVNELLKKAEAMKKELGNSEDTGEGKRKAGWQKQEQHTSQN